MKNFILSFIFSCFLMGINDIKAEEIQRVEPPFWYVNMKNPRLQVMLYGKDISKSKFSIAPYKGVSINETEEIVDLTTSLIIPPEEYMY